MPRDRPNPNSRVVRGVRGEFGRSRVVRGVRGESGWSRVVRGVRGEVRPEPCCPWCPRRVRPEPCCPCCPWRVRRSRVVRVVRGEFGRCCQCDPWPRATAVVARRYRTVESTTRRSIKSSHVSSGLLVLHSRTPDQWDPFTGRPWAGWLTMARNSKSSSDFQGARRTRRRLRGLATWSVVLVELRGGVDRGADGSGTGREQSREGRLADRRLRRQAHGVAAERDDPDDRQRQGHEAAVEDQARGPDAADARRSFRR